MSHRGSYFFGQAILSRANYSAVASVQWNHIMSVEETTKLKVDVTLCYEPLHVRVEIPLDLGTFWMEISVEELKVRTLFTKVDICGYNMVFNETINAPEFVRNAIEVTKEPVDCSQTEFTVSVRFRKISEHRCSTSPIVLDLSFIYFF